MKDIRVVCGILGVCIVAAGMFGCADGAKKLYGVSGAVKWKGKPLDHGAVTFLPEDSSLGTSGGAIIKDGQYAIPAKQGLLPGRYKVMVTSQDPRDKAPDPDSPPGYLPLPKDRIQPKYNAQTILSAEVKTEGQNTFDFEVH